MKGCKTGCDTVAEDRSITNGSGLEEFNIESSDFSVIPLNSSEAFPEAIQEVDYLLLQYGQQPDAFLSGFGTDEIQIRMTADFAGTETKAPVEPRAPGSGASADKPSESDSFFDSVIEQFKEAFEEAGLDCDCDHDHQEVEPVSTHQLKRVSATTFPNLKETDNCCGQIALGTALSAFGQSVSEKEMAMMNPSGIFTAPSAIVEFLNPRVGARHRNDGTTQDLRDALDKGNPVIVLVNSSGTPHWITVTGYQTDAKDYVSHFEIRDQCIASRGCSLLSVKEFNEIWQSPLEGMHSSMPMLTDYHNLWIETGTRTNVLTGHSFSTASEDLGASSINRLVRGWKNNNWPELIQGVSEGLSAIPSILLSSGGSFVENTGDSLTSWGSTRFQTGGFFNRIAGGAGWLTGKALHYTGKGLDLVGDCVATVGRTVGSGVRAVSDFAGSVASKVGSGLSSAARWIGSWF